MSRGRGRASNLLIRTLTAVLGVPVVVLVNALGGWVFAALLGVVGIVSFWEFTGLARAGGYRPALAPGSVAVVAIALSSPLVTRPQSLWTGAVFATIVVAGVWFLLPVNYERGALGWVLTIAGVVYTGVLLGHIGLLRQESRGAWWVLLVLVITWAYDTGAYVAGSAVGKRRFMAHVSPNKTVEGVLGGLIASTIAGLLASPALGLQVWQSALVGVSGGALAQAGDLVESMLKRQTGVKDSGWIVPGHGGLLDRIDGLLFVGPFVYYAARATGHAA